MNKILKISSIILILALFAFSCKHDQGGQNDGAKSLVLSSFKIGDSVYDKENNRISVTKQTVTFGKWSLIGFVLEKQMRQSFRL